MEEESDAQHFNPAAGEQAWGVRAERVRVVASARAPNVTIAAGSSEPPVTIAPSTLVRDLATLLHFPEEGEAGESGAWPRLFQRVALRLEGAGEPPQPSAYTVWVHRSWLARRCPYFGRVLSSGAWRACSYMYGCMQCVRACVRVVDTGMMMGKHRP